MKRILIFSKDENRKSEVENYLKADFPELFLVQAKDKEEIFNYNIENFDCIIIDPIVDISISMAIVDEAYMALIDCILINPSNPETKQDFERKILLSDFVFYDMDKKIQKIKVESWEECLLKLNKLLHSKKEVSLESLPSINFSSGKLKPWKTIKLGTCKNSAELDNAIFEISDPHVSSWAQEMIFSEEFIISTHEKEINLVLVSLADLGFTEKAELEEILVRGKEFGLEPCPAEVGPQLFLQHGDGPKNVWLKIAMKYMLGAGGAYPLIFRVKCGDKNDTWLQTSFVGHKNNYWYDALIVFCLPSEN